MDLEVDETSESFLSFTSTSSRRAEVELNA